MFCFTSRVWKDFNIMLISWNWLNKTVRENCYFWESKSHLCWWKTRHMAYMLGMHWQARCCGCCMRFLGENKLVSHGQVTFWMLHPSCNKKLTKTVAKKNYIFMLLPTPNYQLTELVSNWNAFCGHCMNNAYMDVGDPTMLLLVSEIYRLDIQLQLTESEIDWNRVVYVLEITLRNIYIGIKAIWKTNAILWLLLVLFLNWASLDVPLVEFVYIFTCMPSESSTGYSPLRHCVCTTAFKH